MNCKARIAIVLLTVCFGCGESADRSSAATGSNATSPELTPVQVMTLEERLDGAVLVRLRDREAWNQRIQDNLEIPANKKSEAYAEVGMLYHAYGLFPEALEFYRQAISLNGVDYRWFFLRGTALRRMNDLILATEDFERSAELQPRDVPSLVRLGEILRDQEDRERALESLTQALEQDPNCAAAIFALGQDARNDGRLDQAVSLFQRVLDIQPEAAAVRTPLGLTYRDLGREEDAVEQLAQSGDQGVRLDDPLLLRTYQLGEGWSDVMRQASESAKAEDFEQAEKQLVRAITIDPLSPGARVSWAKLLLNRNASDKAEEQLRLALFLSEENLDARRLLAQIAIQERDWPTAERELRVVTQLDGADRTDRAALAQAFEHSQRPGLALEIYQELRKGYPEIAEFRVSEATQMGLLGQCEGATYLVSAGVEERPNDAIAAHALARLLATCPQTRNAERALGIARSLFDAFPTPGHADALALALASAGDFTQAAQVQLQAIEIARASGEEFGYLRETLVALESGRVPVTPWPVFARGEVFAPPS